MVGILVSYKGNAPPLVTSDDAPNSRVNGFSVKEFFFIQLPTNKQKNILPSFSRAAHSMKKFTSAKLPIYLSDCKFTVEKKQYFSSD